MIQRSLNNHWQWHQYRLAHAQQVQGEVVSQP
jgi:hypothetical protein